ncbi:MAG: regulatory iron-sulfur-containing complex subunit RicT [Thermoanaerobaculia bacterium]
MSGCQGCSYAGISTAVEGNFVGVRFGEETNLTLCATRGKLFAKGDSVIVDFEAGPAFGRVEQSPMPVFKPCQKATARPIIRWADEEDSSAQEKKTENELAAKKFCQERARNLGLQMKVTRVDFGLDSRKATVYFTAEGRIDFRRLVRDMSQGFSAKIKMMQVGARDEAGLLGGVGVCGRTLCCSTWLKDFKPISIQMAKRQNLSLNPSKISGQCGRLLCCLAYEDDQYPAPAKRGAAAPATG